MLLDYRAVQAGIRSIPERLMFKFGVPHVDPRPQPGRFQR